MILQIPPWAHPSAGNTRRVRVRGIVAAAAAFRAQGPCWLSRAGSWMLRLAPRCWRSEQALVKTQIIVVVSVSTDMTVAVNSDINFRLIDI